MDLERIRAAVAGRDADDILPVTPGSNATTRVLDALSLPGGTGLAVLERADELFGVPLVDDGSIRRARPGEGAFAGILRLVAAGPDDRRFEVRRFGDVPLPGIERPIDVDQSNASVVVAEAAVVKLLPRTAPGPQPGLDVPAHLAAVGFAETPRPIGAVLWIDEEDRSVLLATAAAYLPDASDGWDWYPELVLEMLDGGSESAAVDPAEDVGALVARLHRALATPSPVFLEPVSSAGPSELRAWSDRAAATLDDALRLTKGDEGDRLRALEPAIRQAFAAFDEIESTPMMRVHGDLHVGQVFRWAGGLVIGDFDGNPLAPMAERVAPAPPARDVASMVRAIDHVARIAIRRRPGTEATVTAWLDQARRRFLDTYRRGLGDRIDLFDERLLRPFEVAQECHEFVYAARFQPRWVTVPDRSMAALLSAST
jgi:maltokinase